MRFISAIYVSSALFVAVGAAPVAHAPSGVSIVETISEDTDNSVLAKRTGADVLNELDLTARLATEDPVDRTSGPSGCTIA
ncbi:hypothetical protein C8R43DRAFT_1240393 [Mycena crocata]|nr:hypothetical protein C8R43DRAFT_1240393 [Mycena crocata]